NPLMLLPSGKKIPTPSPTIIAMITHWVCEIEGRRRDGVGATAGETRAGIGSPVENAKTRVTAQTQCPGSTRTSFRHVDWSGAKRRKRETTSTALRTDVRISLSTTLLDIPRQRASLPKSVATRCWFVTQAACEKTHDHREATLPREQFPFIIRRTPRRHDVF